MPQDKQEFRNTTAGTIGVVVVLPGGKEQGLPLVSGATVWLSEDDQIATANAPKRDEDNPFVTGALEAVGVPEGVKNRRPIGTPQGDSDADAKQRVEAEKEARAAKAQRAKEEADQREENAARQKEGTEAAVRGGKGIAPKTRQRAEETGAPPQPQGKAAEGSRAAGEEVGTPEAAGKAS